MIQFYVDGEPVEKLPEGRYTVEVVTTPTGQSVLLDSHQRRLPGRKRTISDELARNVRIMHEDRGMSYREIARWLQDKGVPTAQGGPWGHSTVQYLIKRFEG